MIFQTDVPEPDLIDCGSQSGHRIKLQRYTVSDFAILVDGERAGLVRVGTAFQTEIGFEVFPKYRNLGVATAAVRTITDAILDAGHVRELIAVPTNEISQRVLEKTGFKYHDLGNGGPMWRKTKCAS